MPTTTLSMFRLAIISSAGALAASAFTPLVDKHFTYPGGIPYKADTDNLERGEQIGYNRCNSTTEGQESLCQTSFINSIDDFCLWAPISPNSFVGDTEGEMVAWCTKPGRGTRVIPENTLQGVQFMRTPDYTQVVGFIDQSKVNLNREDFGGEMDPHGADFRGNPLGGLIYSTSFGGGFKQVIEWHNFIGGDFFCLKACDPAGPNAAKFCDHIYDRIGCAYNAPNNAQREVYESCQGDNQDFPGVYVQDGVTMTYTQPPESLGAITSIPYVPRVPASSKCTKFASSALYAAGSSVTIPSDSSASTTISTTATTVPQTSISSKPSAVPTITSTTNLQTLTIPPTLVPTPTGRTNVVIGTSSSTTTPAKAAPDTTQATNKNAATILKLSGAVPLMGAFLFALVLV